MARKTRRKVAKKSSAKPRSKAKARSKRCTARTKMGKQCKRPALGGGKFCSVHKRR